ncbi:MAG: hypothetical protein GY757_49375, partial [bacterium]|nr:hypothetical protein [bacterium]
MKFKTLLTSLMISLLSLVIISCSGINNDDNNEIEDGTLTSRQVFHLSGLARVWGFLKYHHPVVTRGELDWDAILLETIDDAKAAYDYDSFNRVIDELIDRAGTPTGTPGDVPQHLAWTQDIDLFNQSVRNKLAAILNPNQIPVQFYVGQTPDGNTDYEYETDPASSSFPTENQRILAVFRYWNIIEYFFPYKDIMDREWRDVLKEYIPRIVAVEDALEYHLTIKELSVQINDGHAFTFSDELDDYFGYYYAPFDTSYIDNQTIATKLYGPSNVQIGDIILRCHDMDINDFREQVYKYTNGSNEAAIQSNINIYVI